MNPHDGPAGSAASTPDRVVRHYLAISGLFTLSASVIWGVNTLFLLDAGLDIFEVFVANSAFTAGTVLFEIPTGVVADTSGRRRSFLLSTAILPFGTLGYVMIAAVEADSIPFVVASLVLGLGFSFYSGAVEAWLVDALRATGYEGLLDPVFARGSMVSGAAMLVGSVGGGLLGSDRPGLALPGAGGTAGGRLSRRREGDARHRVHAPRHDPVGPTRRDAPGAPGQPDDRDWRNVRSAC